MWEIYLHMELQVVFELIVPAVIVMSFVARSHAQDLIMSFQDLFVTLADCEAHE